MVKIEAIIRPNKLDIVKESLKNIGIHGLTVSQVVGCGIQKGYTEVYRGSRLNVNLIPKIRIETVVNDELEEKVIDLIVEKAHTGEIGDGKIFVYPVKNVVRIRTKETGEKAL